MYAVNNGFALTFSQFRFAAGATFVNLNALGVTITTPSSAGTTTFRSSGGVLSFGAWTLGGTVFFSSTSSNNPVVTFTGTTAMSGFSISIQSGWVLNAFGFSGTAAAALNLDGATINGWGWNTAFLGTVQFSSSVTVNTAVTISSGTISFNTATVALGANTLTVATITSHTGTSTFTTGVGGALAINGANANWNQLTGSTSVTGSGGRVQFTLGVIRIAAGAFVLGDGVALAGSTIGLVDAGSISPPTATTGLVFASAGASSISGNITTPMCTCRAVVLVLCCASLSHRF